MVPEQLQNFYRQRAHRLARLSLAEVLANLDEAWLIENGSGLLTAKSIAALTTRCLQREEQRSLTGVSFELLEALRDESVVAQRIQYDTAFAHANNRLTAEFLNRFANDDGSIDWAKLLRFIGGARPVGDEMFA